MPNVTEAANGHFPMVVNRGTNDGVLLSLDKIILTKEVSVFLAVRFLTTVAYSLVTTCRNFYKY